MAKNALKSLEARMDEQLRAFEYEEDERRRPSRVGRAATAGALMAGGALGYKHRAPLKAMGRAGVGKAAGGLDVAGDYLRRKAVLGPRAAVLNPDLKRRAALKGSAVLGSIAGRGRKLVGLQRGQADAIVELAAKVAELELEAEEEMMEFGSVGQFGSSVLNKKRTVASKLVKAVKENPRSAAVLGTAALVGGASGTYEHYKAKKAKRREKMKGFAEPEKQRSKVGMYMAGGPVALYDQKKHRESGLVYRKRDGFKDGTKGGLASVATTAGLGVGGLGLYAAAAKNKLPKGAIRKGGVKAARFLKKHPMGAYYGALGAGSGVGLAVQHRSAEKRRKAALAARLQGGSKE